jgi:hypothetical protein
MQPQHQCRFHFEAEPVADFDTVAASLKEELAADLLLGMRV